jgi:hypothetical protein
MDSIINQESKKQIKVIVLVGEPTVKGFKLYASEQWTIPMKQGDNVLNYSKQVVMTANNLLNKVYQLIGK